MSTDTLEAKRQAAVDIGINGFLERSGGQSCGRCSAVVPEPYNADPAGIVCAECCQYLAELRKTHKPSRERKGPEPCPDCHGPKPYRKRFCPACAAKRRKSTYRTNRRQEPVGSRNS